MRPSRLRVPARSACITRVGADTFGNALLDLWQQEGINTSAVQRDAAAPTGIYFVTHGKAGHEFSYLRAGSAASRMTPQWLTAAGDPLANSAEAAAYITSTCSPADLIAASAILHLSAITLAISLEACDTAFAAMAHAKKGGRVCRLIPTYGSSCGRWRVPKRALRRRCHCAIFSCRAWKT